MWIELTQIESKVDKAEYHYVYTHHSIMKGICHKCNTSQEGIVPTEVLLNEIGTTIIPICEKCRRF